MSRRVQIQANDVSRLLLEVRVVGGHVALDAVRLEPMFAPHPCHHHVADAQTGCQLAGRPMRGAARGVSCDLQNPRLQLRGEHGVDLADMPAVEPGDALLGESLAPTGHEAPAALDALRNLIPRMPSGQQQDQSRPSGILGPIRAAVGAPCQLHTLRVREGDGVCHERHYSL